MLKGSYLVFTLNVPPMTDKSQSCIAPFYNYSKCKMHFLHYWTENCLPVNPRLGHIFSQTEKTSTLTLIPFHFQYLKTADRSPIFLFPRQGIPRFSPIYQVMWFLKFCLYHMKFYGILNNMGLALDWVIISGAT